MDTFGASHYVPVLKCKRGEKRALTDLSPSIRSDITPLIEIVENSSGRSLDDHLDTAFDKLAPAVGTRWCFLDANEISVATPTAASRVFDEAERLGIRFVPVTGMSRTADDIQAAVRETAEFS